MGKHLYKVTWVEQDSGREAESYILAEGMAAIEDNYTDIVKVEPMGEVEEL